MGYLIGFAVTAFTFQIVLLVHFALRKWRFETSLRYGWIVYALSVPAAAVSVILILDRAPWSFWLAGLLYLIWAAFGYTVEYVKGIAWRSPVRWSVFAPYVLLYVATTMFYWWPLALIGRPLWYAFATLFVASTALNVTSHKGKS
jgi:hypothetical protein